MKKRNVGIIFCMILLLWHCTVFGYCDVAATNTEKKIVSENGEITFLTKGDILKKDYRCIVELEIVLEESKKGVLKNEDMIYFKTNEKAIPFLEGSFWTTTTEGVSVEIQKVEENDFALKIQRKDIDDLAKIKLEIRPYPSFSVWENNDILTVIPLWLDTDAKKEHNIFADKENEKGILLNESFLKAVDIAAVRKIEMQKKEQDLKQAASGMVFTVNENYMKWKEKEKKLKYPIFLTDTGKSMISFDDLKEIVEAVKNNQKIFTTKQEGKAYFILGKSDICISLETGEIRKNDILLDFCIQMEDGTFYVPLKIFEELFSIRLVWEPTEKRITTVSYDNNMNQS